MNPLITAWTSLRLREPAESRCSKRRTFAAAAVGIACFGSFGCVTHPPQPGVGGPRGVAAPTVDERDPLASIRGPWIQRAVAVRGGDSVDRVIAIERDGEGWKLTRTEIVHPPAPGPNAGARRTSTVTFRARLDGDRLVLTPIRESGPEVVLTVAQRGGELVLPACIQRDERTFEIHGWEAGGSFRCSADPLSVPEGPATFPRPRVPVGPSTGEQFYASETELFEGGPDRPRRELYFLERVAEARYEERFVLRWDADGIGSLYPSAQCAEFAEGRHTRLPEAERRALEALPIAAESGSP